MAEPIIVVPYNPEWVSTFDRDRAQLLSALQVLDVKIEHIGSTSVPGLAAKPIIDILIVTHNEGEALRCITPIVHLGYECLGEGEIAGRIFFRRTHPHTHHIHLYSAPTNPEIERHLLFRDYLRAHPGVAGEYARLKYALAEKFRDDRETYTNSKSDFVEWIVKQAREEKQKLEG